MKAHDDENAIGRMGEQLNQGDASSWGPIGPDGGPRPDLIHSVRRPSAREWDARHVPCLRSCRHYMEAISHMDHGNAPGSLEAEPLMRHVYCSALPGVFLELSADSPVYECSRWDPEDYSATREREERRRLYLAQFPQHDPALTDVGSDKKLDDLDDVEAEMLKRLEDPQ
jgi:hypothetical protein